MYPLGEGLGAAPPRKAPAGATQHGAEKNGIPKGGIPWARAWGQRPQKEERLSYQRIDRISEEVRREVDRIIREDVSDPRVGGTFSITRAEVTRDLRFAKIYISILEEDKAAPVMAALKSAAGFIRRQLGHNLLIRYAPELIFTQDHNIAYGVHIADVLKKASAQPPSEGMENHGDGDKME